MACEDETCGPPMECVIPVVMASFLLGYVLSKK